MKQMPMRGGQINGYPQKRNGRKLPVARMAGNTHGEMSWTFLVSVIVWLIAAEPFPLVASHLALVLTVCTIALETSLNGVADRYDKTYYSRSPRDNPIGPKTGEFRVLRGGAWGGLRFQIQNVYAPRIHRTTEDSASVFDVHVVQSNIS